MLLNLLRSYEGAGSGGSSAEPAVRHLLYMYLGVEVWSYDVIAVRGQEAGVRSRF